MSQRTHRSPGLALAVAAVALTTGACQEYGFAPLAGYLGKDFYAVDLNNFDGAAEPGGTTGDEAPFSVTLSNPLFSDREASVRIGQVGGDGEAVTGDIGVGELAIFDLPRWDAEDTFVGERAYHIESDVPLTAHQFNPANNEGVFSNDASLLLPVPALGTRYRAACWPYDDEGDSTTELVGAGDFVTVVASEHGTVVSVVPSAPVAAGDGIDATAAGVTIEVELAQGQVLQLQSDFDGGAATDLTGSLITASRPVAVFSGNECAMVPDGVMACDHIEEQLLPVEHWGEHHVAVRFEPRKTEKDVYRVIADQDGTTVETDPSLPGFPVELDGGQFHQFEHDGDFEIVSDAPVSVVQYMTGSQYCGEDLEAIGDPAELVVVPVEQFVEGYIFLTPENYLEDWLTVVAPPGTEVALDDEPLPSSAWVELGSGAFSRARVQVEPGAHQLTADQPVGLVVYGYDDDVSYAYPGGANLGALQ